MKSPSTVFCLLAVTSALSAQQLLTFGQLAPRLTTQSDTIFVVNFWATWCAPCVAELPCLEQLSQQYKDKKVKVLLVSLDHKTQVATKVIPCIQKKNLSLEVVVLSEKDPNKWVYKVDSTWSGSIPATLVFDKNKRQFYEQQFDHFEDLEAVLKYFF
jgi:thiol-disulfide isomerase/thioredoxin